MRKRRVLGVAIALTIVWCSTVLISVRSKKREAPSEALSKAPGREDLLSPLGPPGAKVKVKIYIPFDSLCPSCVIEARKVFRRILRKHPGEVRFEFVDISGSMKLKKELANALRSQGVLPDPNAEAWILVNGRAKFEVDGQTVVLKRLPRPSDRTARLLQRIIDEETRGR